jgi:Protein of unknown function (DUF3662)/FHA domain
MGLQKFEGRLERLMEGTLAKPFRSSVQPIEISRRVLREMDLQRRVGPKGLLAPNHFTVTLSTADAERFANYIDALIRELRDAIIEHAETEGYTFVGPVDVEVFQGSRLKTGHFDVSGEVREGAATASVRLGDGTRIPISTKPMVIGRQPGCDVVVPDTNVSRQHASIRRVDDHYVLSDLGSTNGTRLNGRPVNDAYLSNGDEITVGTTRIVFETF